MSAAPPDEDSDDARLAADRVEARTLAKGGSVSFFGAAFSALLGFALTFLLARGMGDVGSGIVLQATGVFAIAVSLGKLGLDSAAIWLLPRLLIDGGDIRSTVNFLLMTAAVSGSTTGAIIALTAPVLATGPESADVVHAVVVLAWLIPLGVLVLVVLAAVRGLGKLVTYVALGSMGIPAVRVMAVWLAIGFGASTVGVVMAWAAPLPLAIMVGLVLLYRLIRGLHPKSSKAKWPTKPLRRQVFGFALPRTLSAGLEQSLLWLDILLVGAIAGTAAAGIYGQASRFIAAGLIIDTALRVVVSPRFSALLHSGDVAGVQRLYGMASTWLVLFSTPIYLILAFFAPTALSWLGPAFVSGSNVLVILSVGAVITFCAGNIHSVLLMSGRSGWAAFNKAVVLTVNVVGNLLLVPVMGIEGAALSWAVSMAFDAFLAAIEVRKFLGVRVNFAAVSYGMLIPVVCVGIPAGVWVWVWGQSAWGIAATAAVGLILMTVWCRLDAKRLHFSALRPAGN